MGAAARTRRAFSVTGDSALCKGCEICIRVCPTDVLILNDRMKAEAANLSVCTGCLDCEISVRTSPSTWRRCSPMASVQAPPRTRLLM